MSGNREMRKPRTGRSRSAETEKKPFAQKREVSPVLKKKYSPVRKQEVSSAPKKKFSAAVILFLFLLFAVSSAAGYGYAALDQKSAEVTPGAAEMGAVRILENCNIRSAPGTDSEVIGGGKKGQIFEYAGKTELAKEGVKWYCIEYNGRTAWVSKAVAELETDS